MLNRDESQARLAALEELALSRYPELIQSYFVRLQSRTQELPPARREGPTIFDANAQLHERYGARGDCIYLIRPDGYVGYRAQPADPQRFVEYLARIFT